MLRKPAQPFVWCFWWFEPQALSVQLLCATALFLQWCCNTCCLATQLENKENDDTNRRSAPKAGWNSGGRASAAWILSTVLLKLSRPLCVSACINQLGESIQALLMQTCFSLILFPIILEDIWKYLKIVSRYWKFQFLLVFSLLACCFNFKAQCWIESV